MPGTTQRKDSGRQRPGMSSDEAQAGKAVSLLLVWRGPHGMSPYPLRRRHLRRPSSLSRSHPQVLPTRVALFPFKNTSDFNGNATSFDKRISSWRGWPMHSWYRGRTKTHRPLGALLKGQGQTPWQLLPTLKSQVRPDHGLPQGAQLLRTMIAFSSTWAPSPQRWTSTA
jgi:hypothetical protein